MKLKLNLHLIYTVGCFSSWCISTCIHIGYLNNISFITAEAVLLIWYSIDYKHAIFYRSAYYIFGLTIPYLVPMSLVKWYGITGNFWQTKFWWLPLSNFLLINFWGASFFHQWLLIYYVKTNFFKDRSKSVKTSSFIPLSFQLYNSYINFKLNSY